MSVTVVDLTQDGDAVPLTQVADPWLNRVRNADTEESLAAVFADMQLAAVEIIESLVYKLSKGSSPR